MDEWVFWILTCGFSLYFVILMLEFNRPSQKLMEQIDNQEVRRQENLPGLLRHGPRPCRGRWTRFEQPRGDAAGTAVR